jgi:hypothetical protein
MILSVVMHGDYVHGDTPARIDKIVTDLMGTLDSGNPWQDFRFGENASLYFATEPLTADTFAEPPFTWTATHELVVAINRESGFGALRWDTDWVTINPDPQADPAVVGDPHVPTWFHPRHSLPLADVEAAVREYCRSDGTRPASVEWGQVGSDPARIFLSTEDYQASATRPR